MPEKSSRSKRIPKFIKKLSQILQQPENQQFVSWLESENGFKIHNVSRLAEQVLPKYYSHGNMASFVRQLNMYGFVRPRDSSQHVYSHPRFIRKNFNSMRQIKRKSVDKRATTSGQDSDSHSEESSSHSENGQQLCSKLLQQNNRLKEQNEILTKKLLEMQKIYMNLNASLLGLNLSEMTSATSSAPIPAIKQDIKKQEPEIGSVQQHCHSKSAYKLEEVFPYSNNFVSYIYSMALPHINPMTQKQQQQ